MNATNYQLCSYDVWGNDIDGYEVNDKYKLDIISLPESPTNSQILKALKSCGFLKSTVKLSQLEFDGDEQTIYINVSRNGAPFCELAKN